MYGLPMALWLMAGWVLLLAGAVTLSMFVFRLLWFSLSDFVAERSALIALQAQDGRARADLG